MTGQCGMVAAQAHEPVPSGSIPVRTFSPHDTLSSAVPLMPLLCAQELQAGIFETTTRRERRKGWRMSEKAKQVKELVKSKLRNWTGLTEREILSCILALAEAIEELDKPLASPPITRPATAEGGDWRL